MKKRKFTLPLLLINLFIAFLGIGFFGNWTSNPCNANTYE